MEIDPYEPTWRWYASYGREKALERVWRIEFQEEVALSSCVLISEEKRSSNRKVEASNEKNTFE